MLSASEAASPKAEYYKAEACYRELRTDSQKRKYRHNWMRCIEKFESVYRLNPSGPWAAAGLYVSAELYRELAKYSGKKSDLNEARDIYERIIKRFPGSRYRQKAERGIQTLSSGPVAQKTAPTKKAPVKKAAKPADNTARDAYYGAEACYNELRSNSKKMNR